MIILAVFLISTLMCSVQCEQHHRIIESTDDMNGQIYVENYPITNDDDDDTSTINGKKSKSINAIEPNINSIDNSELYRSLIFVPSEIDFGTLTIGTAKSYVVTLINKNNNRSVYLSSISGKTETFYSSFFEDKIISPQSNTTFNVVFLPRYSGNIKTKLLIHTSFGQAKLPVRGSGVECPYKLVPLIGIKAPINSTLEPEIHMYNPHSKPIQILEVYSSGGQFQLELPSGEIEGPQTLWEIPPLATKTVIRIRFHATQPGNHTAYIRIKISGDLNNENDDNDFNFNSKESVQRDNINFFKDTKSSSSITAVFTDSPTKKERILVVPVEFEILNEYGIYSPIPIIDFGVLTTTDILKTIKLNLTSSSGQHKYKLTDHKFDNINENMLTFNKSNSMLTLNLESLKSNYNLRGKLLLSSSNEINEQTVEIPIDVKAIIFNGFLKFERNQTTFVTNENNTIKFKRKFIIENNFDIPIYVRNFSIKHEYNELFQISNLKLNEIIMPSGKLNLFEIEIFNNTKDKNCFQTLIKFETNLTNYELPLIISTGNLERWTSVDSVNLTKSSKKNILDFGTVPYGDFSHFGFIVFQNKNPFPIQILKWNFTNPRGVYYQSMFLGCKRNISKLGPNLEILSMHDKFSLCRNISMGQIAAFELAVQSFKLKSFTGIFKIWTDYEEITTDVKFITVVGRMEIDQSKLHFTDCFPGKRCSADISIHSTFLKTMRVNAITVSVPGLVFEYHTQNNLPEIKANSITDVGRIYFDPKSVCTNRCYIPQHDDLEAPTKRDEMSLDFDENELRRRTEMFRRFKWNLQAVTFTINTSEVRLFEFNSTVDIIWPKLVRGVQTLQTVEAGQKYRDKIRLTNPSDQPLLLDFNLSDPEQAKTTSLSLPLEVVEICVFCYLTDQNVFHLIGGAQQILIPPDSFKDIGIKFDARETGVYSTLLHIRNNLTLYEAVWITAKAVQPKFRFGNRKPGSLAPLLFEINEKALTSCEKTLKHDQVGEEIEPLAINKKRIFTASNSGEVPIFIESFKIGDQFCEGYGFRIIPCESFALKANSTKTIEIIFTPDFTMARVQRPLILKTNLSYLVNYTLVATIPVNSLELCSKAIRRPYWEYHMHKLSIGMLIVAFLFVLLAAFFESDKILKDHVENMSKDKGPVQPPLDLRNIAMQNNTNSILEKEDLYQNGIDKYSCNGKSSVNLKKRNTASCTNNSKKPIQSNLSNTTTATIKENKSWAEELVKKFTSTIPQPTILNKTEKTKFKEERTAQVTPKKLKDNEKKSNEIIDKKYIENKTEQENLNIRKVTKLSLKKVKSAPLSSSDHEPNIKSSKKIAQPKPTDEKKTNEFSANIIPQNDSVQDIQSKAIKKCGKTPGRERKKELDLLIKPNKQQVQRKNSTKLKGNAFQFTSPLGQDYQSQSNGSTSPLNEVNIWDSNQASFSHVVANNNLSSSNEDKFNNKITNSCDWNDMDLKNNETFNLNNNCNDLGPIGTRKSPSSTPVWEPLSQHQNVQRPKPYPLMNNNSFFSNQFSNQENQFQYVEPNQYLGGHSGLLNQILGSSQQQTSQWQPNDLVLLAAALSNNNFPPDRQINSTSWSPMAYPAERENININDTWQTSSGVRPPPGLGFAAKPNVPTLQAQEQLILQMQQCNDYMQQLHAQAQQNLVINSSHNINHNNNNNNNNNNNTTNTTNTNQSLNENLPLSNGNGNYHQLEQQFDPFSSLSSIWSDSWNNNNNDNNNTDNQ